jgi:uncharacterized iron-regulated membrane protein
MGAPDGLARRPADETKLAPATVKWPIRRWVRVAHLWAGVGLGLWLVMLGLTGSALVYQHSLRQVLEPERGIKAGLAVLSLDELLARVHRQRPDLTIIDIEGMAYEGSAWELLIRPINATQREKHSRVLFVDPGTGEVRGIQAFNGTFMGVLAQLHYNLLSGETGLAINAFAGGLAIFFAISGLILWWRGRTKWKNGLRMKFKGASSRARNYSIHSAVGFYASLFLAVAGLSGIYFAVPRAFLSAAARLQGTPLAVMKDFLDPRPSATRVGIPDAPANRVVRVAQEQFPDKTISEIELPIHPMDAWQFHFISRGIVDIGDAELVVVDRRSAEVLAARRTADLPIALRAVLLLQPLHYGTFGGNFTRVLWIFLGLTPAVLFVTGFTIWRKRIGALVAPGR